MNHENTVEVEQVIDLINKECLENKNPSVAGSVIGLKISQLHSGFDMKKYQGLATFIKKYCPDIIQVGKLGGDNLFAHEKRKEEVKEENESLVKYNPWAAFTDPRLRVQLLANPKDHKFKIVSEHTEIPDGYRIIERMDGASYRKIANDFIVEELDSEDEIKISEAVKSISGDNFWFIFVDVINDLFGVDQRKKLLDFRARKIKQLFTEKLIGIGYSKSKAREEIYDTYDDKKKNTRTKATNDKQLTKKGKEYLKEDVSSYVTKELIHEVINHMSQNDLGRIWLPVGAIIESLEK